VPLLGEGPAPGAERGRRESVAATVYQKHSTLQTRKRKYRVWRLPGAGRLIDGVSRKAKLLIEAPVNGGRNYNGPKVEIAALVKSGYMLETPRILQYSSVASDK